MHAVILVLVHVHVHEYPHAQDGKIYALCADDLGTAPVGAHVPIHVLLY